MKRFTLILSLLVAMVTTAMAQIDVTKTYRIKDVASGNYLTAFNHDEHSTGATGGVGIAALDENSKEQVFYLEPTSTGYFLRLASGDYYVVGQSWNVDALAQNGTIFNLANAGNGQFYLMKGTAYFKTQNVDGLTYVFCDAPEANRATWELEVVGESGYATYNTFNANKAYVIKSRERGGLTINKDATGFCSTHDAGRGIFVEHANTDNHFAVVTYDEKSYLYSVKAKKFLKSDKSLTGGIGDVVAFRDASAEGASRMSIYFKDITNANINIGGDKEIQVNWWSAIDHGNAMLFVEVADFDPAEALAVLSNVADVTYKFVYGGEVLATQVTTVEKGSAYPAFNVPNVPLGVVPAENVPEGTVNADVEVEIDLTIDNSRIPFEFAAEGTPTAWYYAQIHVNNKSYIKINENDKLYWKEGGVDSGALFTAIAAEDVDDYSWGFVGSVFGGFKMINKDGRGVKMADDGTVTTVAASDATAFLAMPVTVEHAGAFGLYAQNANGYLNAQATIASWWDKDAGSAIVLTERNDNEISVSELGYATLYLGEPVFIPETVEVYVVSSVEGELAQMTQVTGTLPANTGVILKNAGEHTFTTSVATATVGTNLLQGTLEAAEITKEEGNSYYVLANKNGIGFYNAVLGEDATKFKNAANKAYLVVPGAANVASYSFRFGEGTTGIDQITDNRVQSTAIYDLTGRKIDEITKPGLYIVDGVKKFVR